MRDERLELQGVKLLCKLCTASVEQRLLINSLQFSKHFVFMAKSFKGATELM